MKGIISKLPSEYFGENIFVGASTMSKEEIRRRHTHRLRRRDVGHRLPAPRRDVAEHDRAPAQRLRRRPGRRHAPAARRDRGACYGFDLDDPPPDRDRASAPRRRPRPGRRRSSPPTTNCARPSGGRTSTNVKMGRLARRLPGLDDLLLVERVARGVGRVVGRSSGTRTSATVGPTGRRSCASFGEIEAVHRSRGRLDHHPRLLAAGTARTRTRSASVVYG